MRGGGLEFSGVESDGSNRGDPPSDPSPLSEAGGQGAAVLPCTRMPRFPRGCQSGRVLERGWNFAKYARCACAKLCQLLIDATGRRVCTMTQYSLALSS
jgi:hypothetical protein